jgi:hypothetical protein
MSGLDALNAAAREVARTWPRFSAAEVDAIPAALGGKPEEAIQRAVAAILRRLQPDHVVWSHATCNEGLRGRWTHWHAQGAEDGTVDVIVALPGGRTVWVELKSARGRLEDEQIKHRDRLVKGGHCHAVARSVSQVLVALGGIAE